MYTAVRPLPNLPTAPGDALAGAAFLLVAMPEVFVYSLPRVVAAGVAALCFYLFGLADNDIVGYASDQTNAPERPLPRGEISLRAARVARLLCLMGAVLAGGLAQMLFLFRCMAKRGYGFRFQVSGFRDEKFRLVWNC